MKNCFVPYVPMSVDPNSDPDAAVEEDAAGSEERTVILSVEIENSDSGLGFVVENVSLTISGGLAHATLIGWGDSIHSDVFPLVLKGVDQYNLLYRVSFLTMPEGDDKNDSQKRQSLMAGAGTSSSEDMRRYVAIDLTGHPYRPAASNVNINDGVHLEAYSSRWNCLLDLLTTQQADPPTFYNRPASPLSVHDALPAPPSPFPASKNIAAPTPPPSTPIAPWTIAKSGRNSTAVPNDRPSLLSPPTSGKFTPTSPSAVLAAMNAQTSDLANGGSPTPRSDRFSFLSPRAPGQVPQTPSTPAFPAYATDGLPNQNISAAPVLQAPLARAYFDGFPRPEVADNMVVSVNLLPPTRSLSDASKTTTNGNPLILPHDVFSLDIFILNLSTEVRRCEVAYPTQRRRRVMSMTTGSEVQGLMPLDNRIRVG